MEVYSQHVSVIIPCYNAEAYIERTIASVCAQTHADLEILVVDDGSEDATAAIVARLAEADSRICLLRQSNGGVAAARNLGIAYATGAYVAPLDADDVWYPEKIERQVACMQRRGADCGLVYTWWVALDEEDHIKGAAQPWYLQGAVSEVLTYVNFIGNASNPLFRRRCLDDVGYYNTALRKQGGQGCEDWDLTLRIAEQYDVGVVPAYLMGYRGVTGSMSSNCEAMARSFELVMKDVQRRRPDLPREIVRWSHSHFYLYLMSLSYNGGDFREALYWIRRAIAYDPGPLLAPNLIKLACKSLVRLLLRPLTARIWPDQRAWVEFKERLFGPSPTFTLAEIEEGSPSRRTHPWSWSRWKPYDRICIRRWNRIQQRNPTSRTARTDPEATVAWVS